MVHDDLDMAFGKVRVRFGGRHAGHNGIRDIQGAEETAFARLKIGIGRPESRNPRLVARYVNSDFSQEEREQLEREVFPRCYEVMRENNWL